MSSKTFGPHYLGFDLRVDRSLAHPLAGMKLRNGSRLRSRRILNDISESEAAMRRISEFSARMRIENDSGLAPSQNVQAPAGPMRYGDFVQSSVIHARPPAMLPS
jgi:hypothetical protein